jgi:hypothetical protein
VKISSKLNPAQLEQQSNNSGKKEIKIKIKNKATVRKLRDQ